MKKMTVLTKYLCALLVMCGLFVCPGTETAYAAFTSLTVGGVDALTTSSGSGWSYNASTSTLTISGDIGAVNASTAANSQEVLNVVVSSDATVTGGIYAGGKLNLVVNPGVTLAVNSSGNNHAIASGYHGVQDSIKITGGGTVVAISNGNGDGIKSGGGLWIEGVTVAAQGYNYGLDSGSGRLFITDNSKVYAVSNQNTAIVAPSTENHDVVDISGENTVVVAGFALGDASNNYVPTIGTPINSSIHAGTVKVTGGHLIIGEGFSANTFNIGSMVKVSHSNYTEYIGHLTDYQQNNNGTHTPKCVDGCPVPTTGTAENCTGTTYCNRTICDTCGQSFGTGNGTSHKEGTAATCTTLAVCELCSQSYGEKNPTNHTGTANGDYTYVDGTYHSNTFTCCGAAAGNAQEEHSSESDGLICDKCEGLMLAKVLAEIAAAPSGATLTYTGMLGSTASPYTSEIIMTIPEGVTVNWNVDMVGKVNNDGNSRYRLLHLRGGGTLNLKGNIKNLGNGNNIFLPKDSAATLVIDEGGMVQNEANTAVVSWGGNEIRVKGGSVTSGTYGIYSEHAAVTVTDGMVSGTNYGIYCAGACASVTVTGGSVSAINENAIDASSASVDVTVIGGTVTAPSTVITTMGTVNVSGNAQIIGTGSDSYYEAIMACTVNISGNPTISHSAGDAISLRYNGTSVTFKEGCNATVSGGDYGIYGHVIVEDGAKVTVHSNNSNGIYYTDSNEITVNGELTVSNSTASYTALYAKNAAITVGEKGKLIVDSLAEGIECKNLNVSGTVSTEATSTGIRVAEQMSITGGTVNVTSQSKTVMYVKYLDVDNGVLHVSGKSSNPAPAIWLYDGGQITVSGDSHVTAIGTIKSIMPQSSNCTVSVAEDYYFYYSDTDHAGLSDFTSGTSSDAISISSSGMPPHFELMTAEHITTASNGDGTHSATCGCGTSYGNADCSGGSATCTTQAVCSACGASYGELGDHSWDTSGSTVSCTICGAAPVAHVDGVYFADFANAVAAWKMDSAKELTLLANVSYAETISLAHSCTEDCGAQLSKTLDLNGKTLTSTAPHTAVMVATNIDLTIEDSSGDNGAIVANELEEGATSVLYCYGNLTMNGGAIRTAKGYGIVADNDALTLTDGTIEAPGNVAIGMISSTSASINSSNMTLNGNSVEIEIFNQYASLTITGNGCHSWKVSNRTGAVKTITIPDDFHLEGESGTEVMEIGGSTTVTIKVNHTHHWTYTADDTADTITATCANSDGHCPDTEQSLKLTAPEDSTYSGEINGSADVEGTIEDVTHTLTYHGTGTEYSSADTPVNADTYTVTLSVEGVSVSDTFTISPKDISVAASCEFSLDEASFTYSGEAPALNVTGVDSSVGNYAMQENTDYTVGTVQVNAGSHKVIITGQGNYTGSVELTYEITRAPIDAAVITAEAQVYTGEALEPAFTVKLNGKELKHNVDFTFNWTNNVNVGEGKIVINGIGNYEGQAEGTFAITSAPADLTAETYLGETMTGDFTYGDVITIKGAVTVDQQNTFSLRRAPAANEVVLYLEGGNEVIAGPVAADPVTGAFTLTYDTSNKDIGIGQRNLTLAYVSDGNKQDTTGSLTVTLNPKELTIISAGAADRAYEKGNKLVDVTGVDLDGIVVIGDDVKADLTGVQGTLSSDNAGAYTTMALPQLPLTGNDSAYYTIAADDAVTTSVEITPKEITNPTIVLDASSFVYDGTEKKPAVTAVKDGDDLIDATEYTVSYANNIEMGTATVTLTDVAGGNYTVSGSTTFQITQSGTEMTATADKTSYTYGENITVTGTVKATGTAPATTLTLRSAPAAQQVALFAADGTQLTDPVNVVDGAYTLTYNTADKGILPAASITLTVKFVGDEDMADAAVNVSIALTEKQLTATEATATTRAYEPDNTTVSVTAVTISGVIGTDDVKVDATNLTGEISCSDAGTYTSVKLADLTLIGNDKAFYTISDATVTTSVEITPKEITNPTIVLDASSFVYDGTEKKPAVTSVKDGDDLIDAAEYTVSYANNIEMGTATVSLTDAAGGNYTVSGSTTFQITQSGTEMTATADKTSYTYGDTITVNGTVKATGTAPATTLTLRSAPAAQQVALFAADGTQLTDPVNVVEGAYTLTYNTADKGILPAEAITLTVKFVGDDNMADQSASVTVALTAKSIEPVLSGSASKAYDGTTTVTDAGNLTINLNGVITGDSVFATAAGYVYADETVGQSKTVTANGITLSGADSIFYTLAQTEASAQIGEIKKAMLIGLTEPADITLDVYCADADAVIGKLPDTVVYHLADGNTVDLKVEWSCTAYDNTPGATNTFAWAINDSEKLACYEIAQNVADDGTVIVTNSASLPVTVTGTDTAITYNGTAYDVTQMFAIDSNAGAAVFEIIGGGTGEGTLNGSVLTITKAGTINIKVTTAPNAAYAAGEATAVLTISKGTPAVTVPTGLTAWYGQKISDIALPTVDGGAWSWTDTNSTVGDAGVQTHQAIFTPADTNLWNITTHPVNITVAQAGTSFGEMKVYNGNAETTTFTYGETITVKAEATAVQPAVFSLRSLIAPAKHQMALFIRNADGSEVQISEAVNEQNGIYTMTYNTAGKALKIGDNALIAKFVGDENMADYQETVLVTLNPKELTIASLTAQDRVYEPGNRQVAITGTEVSGKADANDDVSVLTDGMTATISSENVGTYDTALLPQDVSLTGNHAGYYFARGNVAVSIPKGVEITQSTPYTASGAPAQPVFDPIYQDGQTLGDIPVSLPAGTFNVPGTIEWEAPGDTPVTEGTPFTWVFTPDDPNWKPVTGTVVIYPDGEPPVITAPAGDQEVTVYEGEQGTMFITAADATSYQWYINRYDGLGYVPISGATSASYTTSVVNLGNDGFTYYCVASNAYGNAESPVFLLQVLEKIEVPETGDESNIALWAALAILSIAGLTIITMNGRRSKITR